MVYVKYGNYKGGTNNLCVVFDNKCRFATSVKSKEEAIKNFKRKYKEKFKNDKQ